jgi:hypothetical protein
VLRFFVTKKDNIPDNIDNAATNNVFALFFGERNADASRFGLHCKLLSVLKKTLFQVV